MPHFLCKTLIDKKRSSKQKIETKKHLFLLSLSHLIVCDKFHAAFLCRNQCWMKKKERSSKQKIEAKKHLFLVKLHDFSFSLNIVSVLWKMFSGLMMCVSSVKYNFVKPFSPHVESVESSCANPLPLPSLFLSQSVLYQALSHFSINKAVQHFWFKCWCVCKEETNTHREMRKSLSQDWLRQKERW